MFKRRPYRDSCKRIRGVVCAVEIEDSGTSFPGDENACACVPKLISENYARIQSSLGRPCEVDSGSAKHAYALSARSEVFYKLMACPVGIVCADTECVLVYRYERGIERLSSAHPKPLTIGIRAVVV